MSIWASFPGSACRQGPWGGGVSASLGRGLLELDLRAGLDPARTWTRASAGPPGARPEAASQHWLPAADVGMFCGDLVAFLASAPDRGVHLRPR